MVAPKSGKVPRVEAAFGYFGAFGFMAEGHILLSGKEDTLDPITTLPHRNLRTCQRPV